MYCVSVSFGGRVLARRSVAAAPFGHCVGVSCDGSLLSRRGVVADPLGQESAHLPVMVYLLGAV